MMRTVFDTNPLIAAFINPNGYPARLLDAWRRQEFTMIVSPAILEEYERVLFFPDIRAASRFDEAETYQLLEKLKGESIQVSGETLHLRAIPQDPTDDKFFVAAVEGQAEYIVTKEQRWKKLKTFRGIRVVSPSKFYEILKKRKP